MQTIYIKRCTFNVCINLRTHTNTGKRGWTSPSSKR